MIAFLLTMSMAVAGLAQEATDNVYVYGTVKNYVTSVPLEGVEVLVYRDEVRVERILTDSLGRYEAYLDYNHVYKLWFMQAGMVTKHIEVDARAIPNGLRAGGFGMNVDMRLFRSMPNLDMSILDQPIGKARYSPVDSTINWDLEYTESIRARVTQAMMRMDSMNRVHGTDR